MSQNTISREGRRTSGRDARHFRLTPMAAAVAAVALFAAGGAYAQEKSSAELQAEITRLRQALDKAQQDLARKEGQAAPAASVEPSAGPASAVPEEAVALDAVVVRSRNRIERLQDVPLSVSVVGGKELDRLGAGDISEITKRAGNISWNQGNQRTSSLSIRGIGKQGQTEAQDPPVGVIVDGVSYAYNALASSVNFHDVEAVEVTRGPQGTLLGKNTSLGAVNIVTRKPSFTPSADYSLTLGQRDRVIGKLAAGGPVVDDLLAWRGSFVVEKGRGDIYNNTIADQTYQNLERVSGRVQFLLTPTADFNARLSAEIQPRSSETTNSRTIYTPTPTKYADGSTNPLNTDASTRLGRRWFTQGSYSYANDYLYGGYGGNSVNMDASRGLVTGSRGTSAELNWNLGEHTLTSITAYRDYHFNAINDEGTPFDINRNSGGFLNDYRQFSQELRLSSKTGGLVDYQTGLYFINVYNVNDYRRSWGNDAGAWFASTAQYNRLDADAAGRYLMQNSLGGLSMSYNSPTGYQNIHNKSAAIFGQANWHITEPFTVTTGVRLTQEDRTNTGSSYIKDNGNGGELNPVSVNGVQLGGFNSDTKGNLGTNSASQLALANATALKYFGVASYSALSTTQKQQIADAKNIRASNMGVIFAPTEAQPYRAILPAFVISPTYKFSDTLTTYVSYQHGEKSGISQLTNGISNQVRPEKNNSFEIGFKSALLDKTLILNADAFLTNIRDYQQTTRVLDIYTTALKADSTNYYTNATGNVPKVQSKGVEVDGVYAGIRNVTLRFSGAYTDARYKEFTNSAQPNENGYTGAAPYQDVSGQTLPGASKWSFNVGADYARPVLGDKLFHTSFNTSYYSRFNSDVSLSTYSWIPDYSITDLAVGIGKADRSFDVSLLVKNAFNDHTPLSQTWNSYVPAVPRWIGLMFTGKL